MHYSDSSSFYLNDHTLGFYVADNVRFFTCHYANPFILRDGVFRQNSWKLNCDKEYCINFLPGGVLLRMTRKEIVDMKNQFKKMPLSRLSDPFNYYLVIGIFVSDS